MRAMICGGKRRVCLTDSSKHNGSIYQEQPEIRVWGGDGREARSVTKQTLGVSWKGRGEKAAEREDCERENICLRCYRLTWAALKSSLQSVIRGKPSYAHDLFSCNSADGWNASNEGKNEDGGWWGFAPRGKFENTPRMSVQIKCLNERKYRPFFLLRLRALNLPISPLRPFNKLSIVSAHGGDGVNLKRQRIRWPLWTSLLFQSTLRVATPLTLPAASVEQRGVWESTWITATEGSATLCHFDLHTNTRAATIIQFFPTCATVSRWSSRAFVKNPSGVCFPGPFISLDWLNATRP